MVSRVALSMFWFGIQASAKPIAMLPSLIILQSYTGGECVYQMLKAIWPSVAQIPNQLPESAGITTTSTIATDLYHLLSSYDAPQI